MYLHRKLETGELIDLLAAHTNRFMQIMIYGETYVGEHDVCKRTVELIQAEIFSRQPDCIKPAWVNTRPANSFHHKNILK